MSKISDFMIGCCEFFGADDALDVGDLGAQELLSQLVWDLNDAATDYGRRVIIDPASHTIRLELVRGDESIEFADLALVPSGMSGD